MKFNIVLVAIGAGFSFVGAANAQTAKPDQAEKVTWPAMLCNGQPTVCNPLAGQGFLFAKPGQTKVVMISHGSQGIDSRMYDYVDVLQKEGFAALVIDHFTPRGVSSTYQDYAATNLKGANTYNMATDSLTAAYWLHNTKGFEKVGSIGESQGGQSSTTMQKKGVIDGVVRNMGRITGTQFNAMPVDAVVGLYGYCGYRDAKQDKYTNTPYLMIAGGDDDETPAKYCEDYIPWMNERGAEGNAKIVVIPGEGHSFDAPYKRQYNFGMQYTKCNVLMDERGATELNSNVTSATLGEAQSKCQGKGYHSGYWKNRFIAVPYWAAFFKQNL